MNPALPPQLKTTLDALLYGVSRKELAARSTAISQGYRGGGGSAGVIASEADALAYLVARLPATYAVAAAVLDQMREAAPDFTPETLLDAGGGPGTASLAAHETWPTPIRISSRSRASSRRAPRRCRAISFAMPCRAPVW